MTTRENVAQTALSFNGDYDNDGFNCANQFSVQLGRPTEAWCGDFVTDVYKRAQIPLPSMQPGCRTGFAYCPDAVAYAEKHNATRDSWTSEPGDIVLFDFDTRGLAGHTELVTDYRDGLLYTIGGNSGGSNVDHFTGLGGVHRHTWPAPAGVGNAVILTVLNTAKAVGFGGPAHPTKPGQPAPAGHRLLMLKSPLMTGQDVKDVQQALNQLAHVGLAADSVYGVNTCNAVMSWQEHEHLTVDGIVGPHTRAALGLPA